MTLVELEGAGVVKSDTGCALAELRTIVKKQGDSSQKFEISWFLFSPKPMLERWPLIVSKVI